MSKSSTLRQILAESLRTYQTQPNETDGPRVKFLIVNAVIEGTLVITNNPHLLSPNPYSNGQSYGGEGFDAVMLTDVAVRPLDQPEVHVGLNSLQLFLDSITGVIS